MNFEWPINASIQASTYQFVDLVEPSFEVDRQLSLRESHILLSHYDYISKILISMYWEFMPKHAECNEIVGMIYLP